MGPQHHAGAGRSAPPPPPLRLRPPRRPFAGLRGGATTDYIRDRPQGNPQAVRLPSAATCDFDRRSTTHLWRDCRAELRSGSRPSTHASAGRRKAAGRPGWASCAIRTRCEAPRGCDRRCCRDSGGTHAWRTRPRSSTGRRTPGTARSCKFSLAARRTGPQDQQGARAPLATRQWQSNSCAAARCRGSLWCCQRRCRDGIFCGGSLN